MDLGDLSIWEEQGFEKALKAAQVELGISGEASFVITRGSVLIEFYGEAWKTIPAARLTHAVLQAWEHCRRGSLNFNRVTNTEWFEGEDQISHLSFTEQKAHWEEIRTLPIQAPAFWEGLTDEGLGVFGLEFEMLTLYPSFPFRRTGVTAYRHDIQKIIRWVVQEKKMYNTAFGTKERQLRCRLFMLLPRIMFGQFGKAGEHPPSDAWQKRMRKFYKGEWGILLATQWHEDTEPRKGTFGSKMKKGHLQNLARLAEQWVREGNVAKAIRTLQDGKPWDWSPALADIYRRLHFPQGLKITMDLQPVS